MTLSVKGKVVRVDVGIRAALSLRQHAKECIACFAHDRPTCPVALSMVEDALSMAGLYDMERTGRELACALRQQGEID